MALARVIEVVARRGQTPVLEHADQATRFQMTSDVGFESIGEPEPRQRCVENEAAVVEDELSVDPHLKRATTLLELPGEKPAGFAVAVSDAAVSGEVLRLPRRRVAGEVGGRSHDGGDDVGSDAHRNHVLVDHFPETDPGVVAVGDDIDEGLAKSPYPMVHVCCSTKSAVDTLTRSLAMELGPRKIRVVGIAPCFTATEGNAESSKGMSDFPSPKHRSAGSGCRPTLPLL